MSTALLPHFGKLLIVDDVYSDDIKDLVTGLVESGIPVEYWNGEGNQHSIISNVRILILDMDLSGGTIPKSDNNAFYAMAVDILSKIHGPYIVIVYAREFDNDDLSKIQSMYEAEYGKMDGFIDGISGYRKSIDPEILISKITKIIKKEEIFQLILLWEKILDKAKDLGLSKFIRLQFETEITAFVQSLAKDVGAQSLSREFISNMLRFVSRYTLRGDEFKQLSTILENLKNKTPVTTISDQLLQNRNMYFTPHEDEELWTGDIFKISSESNKFGYKLLLTPECYITQDKLDSFLLCDGFTIDFESLSDTDHPIYQIIDDFALLERGQMSSDKYQKKLKKYLSSLTKFHHRLYPIWNFQLRKDKYIGICFDFQNINSISKDKFNEMNLTRVSRLDSPYIVELMQDYAYYSTKVGTLSVNRPHIDIPENPR